MKKSKENQQETNGHFVRKMNNNIDVFMCYGDLVGSPHDRRQGFCHTRILLLLI